MFGYTCPACSVYESEVDNLRLQIRKLTELVEKLAIPVEAEKDNISLEFPEPLQSRETPWAIRKAFLEEKSRKEAAILRTTSIEELEEGMEIDSDTEKVS